MTDLSLDQPPRQPTADRLDERLIEMRSQRYAEKTTLGGSKVGNRLSLFLFVGIAAAIALGVLFYETDRRLSAAVASWERAQQVGGALSVIERSVNDIRLIDRRFNAEPTPANAQAMQRALNAVAQGVENLGGIDAGADISDAVVTVRDGLAQFAGQFTSRNRVLQEVGYTEDTGLRADRKAAAQDVRAKLKVIGLELSVPDFDRIHAQGPGGVSASAYDDLRNRIESVATTDATITQARSDALAALGRHREVSAKIAERRAVLKEAPPSVDDIIDYIGPSLRVLADYSAELGETAPAAFQAERQLARKAIAGGSAAILTLLVIAGLLLMRTITRPLDRLATAASRLSDGDRSVSIPARGNADQIGIVARSLDAWLDNLTEIDHLRAELEDVRLRLTAEAELRAAAETAAALKPEGDRPEVANDVFESAPVEKAPEPEPEPAPAAERETVPLVTETPLPLKRILQGVEREDEAARGTSSSPIGTASQELTRFSEFVNAATRDVERTENLMRRLSDTAGQIADLEHCVETIRDEAHLLVFRSPGGGSSSGADDDTLVYISGEPKRGEGDGGKRFDTIRESVDRAERLVVGVRRSLEQVTALAQEIASDASAEALEATNKLLSQSEYLQNMLDDLVHKMSPVSGRDGDEGGRSTKQSRRDRD
ncbi:MAG: HAMP domain-containing protein [Rhodospirillales bacterium]